MWLINLFLLLPVLFAIIFIIFTVKSTRWGDRKVFTFMLIFDILLAIFSFLVIFGYYKVINQRIWMTVPTLPPPDYTGQVSFVSYSCYSWTLPPVPCFDISWPFLLEIFGEVLSIVTFIIGLIYYFKKRPKIKKTD